MLVKTDKVKVTEVGGKKVRNTIYLEKTPGKNGSLIDGKEGTLKELTPKPSIRHELRRDKGKTDKGRIVDPNIVKTNRKPTKGRVIQVIGAKKIAHETPNAISRKTALLAFNDKVAVNKSKNDKSKKEKDV